MKRVARGRGISIVDDDPSMRAALMNLLTSAGHQVRTFVSAEDFLGSDHLHATGCLLLDLRMPGMSGLELQERLAATQVRIPIIFLTAHGNEDARARALRAGAIAFFGKPFNEDVLLSAVTAALSD
jgi:FixJ family two-component response regulator